MSGKKWDLVAPRIPEFGKPVQQYDQWSFALGHIMHANTIGDDILVLPCFRGCQFGILFSLRIAIHDRAFYLLDQIGYGNTTRTGISAVKNRATTPHTVTLPQNSEAFGATLVATVEDEAMRINYRGWPNPVGIAPHRRARTCTGTAQNTLCAFIITGTLGGTLQAFSSWLRIV